MDAPLSNLNSIVCNIPTLSLLRDKENLVLLINDTLFTCLVRFTREEDILMLTFMRQISALLISL